MSDLLSANFDNVQSNQNPFPATIASSTTIAPSTYITFLTGSTAVATITPPVTGSVTLVLVATVTTVTTVTTGNIALASTLVANKALLMTYDPVSTKWYPSY